MPDQGIGAFLSFGSLQIGLVFLAISILSGALRNVTLSAASGIAGLIFLSTIISAVRADPTPRINSPSLTLIWFNAHHSNKALDNLFEANKALSADVIAIAETPVNWEGRYANRLRGYSCIEWDRSNPQERILIASRKPCSQSPDLPAASTLENISFVQDPSGAIVVGLHAPRPFDLSRLLRFEFPWNDPLIRLRDQTISRAALLAAARGQQGILVGDFNATAWSYPLQRLDELGLQLASCGPVWASTWVHEGTGLGVGIDHVLTTADLDVHCEIGPDLGSDHRPLIVRVYAPKVYAGS
jgi:endonuclease/exonuclease/phosphatase (EEP) superfamily protein YafD